MALTLLFEGILLFAVLMLLSGILTFYLGRDQRCLTLHYIDYAVTKEQPHIKLTCTL